ncbi:substrate-binding domain-containing protein [Catenuloplanes japonicus]|uniref:substrate-binding domain-containing protein n=1 Tax=Catenuloplanes japonicus TaxID=33876 RepID=UPI0005269BFA|nr:substrate-binding domain-containing protein [Catenuloplanes japonicus]
MKFTGRLGAAALALAAFAAVSACSVTTDEGTAEPVAAGQKIKIGFSQVTQQSPFYVELGNGAKEAVAAAGDELLFVDANGDVTKQNNDVQDLISRGINVLIINPVDPKGVAPALAAAQAAGIKVITVDRPVDSGSVAHVGRDNVKMGELVGEQMVTALGEAGGKVLEIQGDAGGAVARDRSEGFHKAAAANPNIKIVEGPYANYIRAEAVTAMQDLLQANQDVKAVYAHNDDMALGALQVLSESNRTDVKVFGVDGLMEAVKAIATGDQYVATSFNDPIGLGAKTVETARKVAEGQTVESFVDAGTALISKENAPSLVGTTLFAKQP